MTLKLRYAGKVIMNPGYPTLRSAGITMIKFDEFDGISELYYRNVMQSMRSFYKTRICDGSTKSVIRGKKKYKEIVIITHIDDFSNDYEMNLFYHDLWELIKHTVDEVDNDRSERSSIESAGETS